MENYELEAGIVLKERFRISRSIGRGSYGTVYLADDIKVPGAQWAIKEVRENTLEDDERKETIERFQHEASLLKSLNHTGIPKVIDLFSVSTRHYMVMEYIEGETLEDIAKKGVPCEDDVVLWALKVCDIFIYLHRLAPSYLIYRDLKPSNIVVTPRGRVVLIDFGIARFYDKQKTRDTCLLGTPGFCPPEQYGIYQSDARSDIYSLGATMYHLLSKKDLLCFNFKIPPLSQFNKNVSPELEKIISRCLEAEPGKRYQKTEELKEALKRLALKSSRVNLPPQSHVQIPSGAKMRVALQSGKKIRMGAPIEIPSIIFYWMLFLILTFINNQSIILSGFILLLLASIAIISVSNIPFYFKSKKYFHLVCSFISLMVIFIIFLYAYNYHMYYSLSTSSGSRKQSEKGRFEQKKLSSKNDSHIAECRENLLKIKRAIMKYAKEHKGDYPPSLNDLVPTYIEFLPECPNAGIITYSYKKSKNPKTFTIWCKGAYHIEISGKINYPQYDSIRGFIEN